jgi:putative tricarboxylic transport membrane protein
MQRRLFLSLPALPVAARAAPAAITCMAPAKPGGGFDLSCHLLRDVFGSDLTEAPGRVAIRYIPGGIGAVAFDHAVREQWGDPHQFIAFSTGSLVNLAQGKFGPHHVRDVRWLATFGSEFGTIAVRTESRFRTLAELTRALARNPAAAVFAAGGTVGSQDWIKAALLVKAAGADHRGMRFVAFEGGGQALDALRDGHVDVFCGDMLEAVQALPAGGIRVLAVLAPRRVSGKLASVPTAREQGVDLVWPTVRGFYMGPRVPDRDFAAWAREFRTLLRRPRFLQLLASYGLEPHPLVTPEIEPYVEAQVSHFRELARSLALRVV